MDTKTDLEEEFIPVNVVTTELLKILKDKTYTDPWPKIKAAELLMSYVNGNEK